MAGAETAVRLYFSEFPSRERLFLAPASNLVVAGFGPATAGALLRIVREMNLKGQIPPNITIIDKVNYFSQTRIERCSSCAGLLTIQGLERLTREFDPAGEVLRIIDDKVIINRAGIPQPQDPDAFPQSMERTLSEVRVSEMAFYMGLDWVGFPVVHLPREHQMFAAHRHGGPVRLQPARNIGYTAKKHFGANLQRAHVFISPAEVPAKRRDLYLGRGHNSCFL